MAIFSRYAKVLEADGSPMRVRAALALINQALDEYLAEQEGEYDTDTRWALAWYEQYGFNEGPFGVAETLSKAKNTSVEGLGEAGILFARAGKVRLLRRGELGAPHPPAPSPTMGRKGAPPSRRVGERPGVRETFPSPLVGEGSGVRETFPSRRVGERPGTREAFPSPLVGEGSGVRETFPSRRVGERLGAKKTFPSPLVGEGSGVRGHIWDPSQDKRPTAWEAVQYLVRALDTHGEQGAAQLLSRLGGLGDVARDLAYRLYTICERKGWAQDALGYNMLVVAWPRLKEMASRKPDTRQEQLF